MEPITSIEWHKALAAEYDRAEDQSPFMFGGPREREPSNASAVERAQFLAVGESYAHLAIETARQYRKLTRELGISVIHTDIDPYESSDELFTDLDVVGRLGVYKGADLPDGHPMSARAILDGEDTGLTVNDLFRAVHDYFGHYGGKDAPHYIFGTVAAALGGDGLDGEELAYQRHREMYSDRAWMALTVETRCQTAANNLLPRVVDVGGFIEQKAIYLPEWCYRS